MPQSDDAKIISLCNVFVNGRILLHNSYAYSPNQPVENGSISIYAHYIVVVTDTTISLASTLIPSTERLAK